MGQANSTTAEGNINGEGINIFDASYTRTGVYLVSKPLPRIIKERLAEHYTGDILQHLRASHFSESERLDICRNLLHIVSELHERGILHGSICASNVIWKDNSVSLVNAQLYTTFQHRLSHVPLLPCTPYRFKDELARDEYKPSKLGDMYALSVLFYAIFSENEPYAEYALSKRVCKIACVGHSKLRKPVLMPEHLWNVLVDCWSTRSEGREVALRRLAAVLQ